MNTNLISLFFCYSILLNSQNDILIINVNNQNCIQLLIEKQQPMSTSDNNFNKDQSPDTMPKQGYNTKNRLKKKAKKDNGMQKNKQQRITNYFNANYFSSSNQAAPDPEEVKINELKQQMNLKDKQIDKLREQKQFIQNKMSLLYMQTKTYKNKTKEVLIKTLTQNAQIKRQIRRRVDMKLGYFTNDMRDFVFGEEFAGIQLVIKQKNTELDMLTSQLRKCKSDEQKDRLKFAMNFVKKQIAAKEQQFKNKQKTLAAYKAKLKLGVQELKCYYAQEKWPIVKDSLGYERYVTLELVGKGGFGEVYKCYDLQKNQYVAIKINLYQNKKQDQTILKHVKRQVETQKSLKHPNIVQIKQILQVSESRIIFVLQFCEGPQLSIYIRQRKCIQQRDAKNIIHQVFCALNYLNQLDKKVIHYDLKPSNIIFHHGKIKILDFGLCKLMDSKDDWMQLTSQGLGTYYYLPPQTFERQKTATISDNVDVWSAGVIFYEMLYGKKPFGQGVSQKVILKKDLILNSAKKLQFPIQNPNKYKISSEAKNFIQQCLCYEPQKRLSISEAYNHSYFKL